ncbi:MAG: glycine zipper family protein [Pyrinomonadaceae bacterium]
MKKLIVSLMCLIVFAAAAIPAEACARHHHHSSRYARSNYSRGNSRYATSASNGRYNNSRNAYYSYGQPRQRSFWQKHRDKLTLAGGTAGGALVGGLIGGHKGAAIGALSGAGGSALYTYKLRNRNRRY